MDGYVGSQGTFGVSKSDAEIAEEDVVALLVRNSELVWVCEVELNGLAIIALKSEVADGIGFVVDK